MVIFSYLILKVLYFPAPSDWSTVTFGFVTVIWVSDFVTVVSDVDDDVDGCSTDVDADVGSTFVVDCVEVTVVVGSLVVVTSSALTLDVARNISDNVSAVTNVTFFINYTPYYCEFLDWNRHNNFVPFY